MLIQSYGLFWEREDVAWTPGHGFARHLWGRRNKLQPALRICDAWRQHGLYVLYGNTGPYYVGIARQQHLGKRLADHTTDEHADYWQRFSWFGFLSMDIKPHEVSLPDPDGLPALSDIHRNDVIKDMEALLIKSMGTYNIRNENFTDATEWQQIEADEAAAWLSWLPE